MIKRYDLGIHDEIEEAPEGIFVRHADHKERVERLEAALKAFMSATESGVQGGLVNMSRLKGRAAFKDRIDAIIEQARLALTNDAGEGA